MRVWVDIDIEDVVDELTTRDLLKAVDTKDLREEIDRRDRVGSITGPDVPTLLRLSSWDAELLKEAVAHDDTRRVTDLLKGALS